MAPPDTHGADPARPGSAVEVPARLFDDDREQRWRARIRAHRTSLPLSGRDQASHLSIFTSNASGTREVHAWNRRTGDLRQVTDRPAGTTTAAISPDGEWIWWFDDAVGNEFGRWVRQPYSADTGVAAAPALLGLPDGYSSGIAMAADTVVVGLATDDGPSVWTWRTGEQTATCIYSHREDAMVRCISPDGLLVALQHSEHGDATNPGIRILRTDDGSSLAERRDPGTGLTPLGFAPDDAGRLLLSHERHGRTELMVWDAFTGQTTELTIPLSGDLRACWGEADSPTGTHLVIAHDHAARSGLYRWDLATETLEDLLVPNGAIGSFSARPDGTVEYEWSSGRHPWSLRRCAAPGEHTDLLQLGDAAPPSVDIRSEWVAGPGGDIHTLVSVPATGASPHPTVLRLHGGPHSADRDEYSAMRAAWIDDGFAVIQPNYRGSSGYGPTWRNAIAGRPGLTELEDVIAVLDWAIDTGITDPARVVIEGYSWGGYLALLAAGVHPDRWAAAIGGLPVADFVAAYAEEAEPLKALDRALFRGTPKEVPERYHAASPITYAARVTAPVLILAGRNDPRCPIGQIENFVDALAEHGRPPAILRYDAGHGSHDSGLVETFVAVNITFARAALHG